MIFSFRHIKKILISFMLFFSFIGIGFSSWQYGDNSIESIAALPTTEERAVCYNSTTSVQYTTIERALLNAQSGQEIFVYPGLTKSDGTIYPIYINDDCTVPSGVTLSFPYSETTYFNKDEHGTGSSSSPFADQDENSVKKYRKTQVILGIGTKSITLTVKGTLNIGGVLSNPQVGVSGQTAGAYCEITMGRLSTISCDGGTINCYGYIKRVNSTNGAKLEVKNGGVLLSPFVIYDFKGGGATTAINNMQGYSKYCPFQVFDFCNLQTSVYVYSGSYWKTRACIYIGTNKTYYPEVETDKIVTFIGSSSEKTALILSSGYILVDYVPSKNGITTQESSFAKTNIELCGAVDIGSFALTIKVSSLSVSINTNDFFFPISYRFSFSIKKEAALNVSKKVKLMNGASLLIEDGGVMNVKSSLIIYDDFEETTKDQADDAYPQPYPSGIGKATLINNGTINVTENGGIGGFIDTKVENAILNYHTANYSIFSAEFGGYMPSSGSAATGAAAASAFQVKNPTGNIIESGSISSGLITYNNYKSVKNGDLYGWNPETETSAITSVTISSIGTGQDNYNGLSVIQVIPNPSSVGRLSLTWELISGSNITISSKSGNAAILKNSSSSAVTAEIKVTVTDEYGNSVSTSSKFEVPKKKASCILPTAKVLMADGSYKLAGDIRTGDIVISFNHETGKFERNKVIGNDDLNKSAQNYNVIHLEFTNGKTTDFVDEHGYLDTTLNRYVYLHEEDASDYVGHEFAFYENGQMTRSKLCKVSQSVMYTTLASPATANHLNIVVDDMLTIAGGLTGLFNIFEYDPDTLAFDVDKMQRDIDTYGLLGYEYFEEYFPEEIYNLLPCKYLGVSIGKGLITWDVFESYVEKWEDQLMENI